MDGKSENFKFIDLQTEGGYHSIALSQKDRKNEKNAYLKYKQVTIIVSEKITNSQNKLRYNFVKAKTLCGFSDVYLELFHLKAGDYRICVFLNEGEQKNDESVTFSVYSPAKFGIKENRSVDSEDFLNRSMLSFAREFGDKIILNPDEKEDVWIINQFIPRCIFGLFGIHVGKNSVADGYFIKAGEKQYTEDNHLVLSDSLKGTGLIEMEVKVNS